MTRQERWIYRDMIDVYYDTEGPFPDNLDEIYRMMGVRRDEDKEMVAAILLLKFELRDTGYHHDRCDTEIAAYRAKAEVAQTNGKKGGRPPKNNPLKPTGLSVGCDQVLDGNPDETTLKANQEPRTNIQEPKKKTSDDHEDCGEAQAVDVAKLVGPPAYTLPLNTGDEFPIPVQRVAEFSMLYPVVDVMQELRKMRGWLTANPAKRKTKSGIMKFVNAWLSKQQDLGGTGVPAQRVAPQRGQATDQKFRPNGSDFSSSREAMERSMAQHGVSAMGMDDIDFN